jgi:protein-S-isoprenylcysteine O-methyltransferase Ste14
MNPWPKIARRIRVPLGFVLVVIYFWLAQPSWRSLLLGLIGIVPGLVIRALASGHVRKNEALATSGPYAYTRNPLYLGSLLMGAGFATAARSWWIAGLMAVLFFVIYIPVIRDEEEFLRQQFPEFEDYARNVPRMLPRLTPFRDDERETGKFSVHLYQEHREYNALLGAAAIIIALIAKKMFFR